MFFNAGATYPGQTNPDSTGGGITERASSPRRGLVLTHDGRRDFSLPSYMTVDVGLSYRLKLTNMKTSHTLRLNVENILDEDYIDLNKKAGDRRAFFITYAINH